jgi:hypothetical protein
MNNWKSRIIAGNERFVERDFESARMLYEAACLEAEVLLTEWQKPEEAVSAFVISYHNMADLYQRQGKSRTARSTLEKVHQHLLRTAASTPVDDVRHGALCRGINETYSALLTHKRCHLVGNVH